MVLRKFISLNRIRHLENSMPHHLLHFLTLGRGTHACGTGGGYLLDVLARVQDQRLVRN
mgnify:CR=1 FL=1